MKYIGRDFAKKDWINSDNPDSKTDRKELYKNALKVSFFAVSLLLIINYFNN